MGSWPAGSSLRLRLWGQFSWALSGIPAWLQVSVCPDSDSWLSSKAGAGPSQDVGVVMLSMTCVPVLSVATICSTDWHDGGQAVVIADECVSGSGPVGTDHELVDAAAVAFGFAGVAPQLTDSPPRPATLVPVRRSKTATVLSKPP